MTGTGNKEVEVDSRVTIGIIGAGRIGTVHARTLAWRIPRARIVAIADSNLDAAKKLGVVKMAVSVLEEKKSKRR